MALEDFALEVLAATGADGGGEVAVVVAVAGEAPQLAIIVVERPAGIVAGEDDVAVGAMEDVADRGAAVGVGLQAADFEDQLAVAVIEDGHLRVGGLAVVGVAEAAAEADDGAGEFGF